MSTHCLIRVFDEQGEEICTIFKWHDGDPGSVEGEAGSFLRGRVVTNGIAVRKDFKCFSGMNDVASSLIAFLKNQCTVTLKNVLKCEVDPVDVAAGGIYVFPSGYEAGVSFEYHVTFDGIGKPPVIRQIDR